MAKAKKTKKILIVEDDSAIGDIYSTVLKGSNFDVELINSGRLAIERIREVKNDRKTKPDIVILDLILPDMNGLEVLREIRKNSTTYDTVVFIFTNQAGVSLTPDLKVDKFILKANTTPTQLLKIIKRELKLI